MPITTATGYARPTLTEIIERTRDDINSRVANQDARIRRTLSYVLSLVVASASNYLFSFAEHIAKQIFADLATGTTLERIADLYGISRLPATFFQGTVTFTGVNGSTIPAGTEVIRTDGTSYTTDALATISGGTATVAITADDAGEDPNMDVSTQTSLTSPLVGVDATQTVAAVTTEGDDAESDAALRTRVLERLRNAPQGGAASDYEQAVLNAGVASRVFVTPNDTGAGTVGVRFAAVIPDGGDSSDLIPTAGEVSTAQTAVDDFRPVTANALVTGPTSRGITITLSTLEPNTAAVQAAVLDELHALFIRRSEPGDTIFNSEIREAISLAAGEQYHVVSDIESPTATSVGATGDIVQGSNELATLDGVTFPP